MNRLIFTPALSSGMGSFYNSFIDGKRLTWWNKDSIFRHDGILISAGYQVDEDTKDRYKFNSDTLLVGDSGGFQLHDGRRKLDPLQVLRWEEANCDIGFSLDYPPYAIEDQNPVLHSKTFYKRADISRDYIKQMLRNKTNDKLKFYGVLQGCDLEECNYWYGDYDDYNLDGLALAIRPSANPFQVALKLAYAHEKGYKNVHVLTAIGPSVAPVTIYASKYFDLVTFDSAGFHTAGGVIRRYILSYLLNFYVQFGEAKNELREPPCDCPVCQTVTMEQLATRDYKYSVATSLHNLYRYIEYVHFMDRLKNDKGMYTSLLVRSKFAKAVEAINMLDECIEHGIEDVYGKYFTDTTNVKNIFG